MNHARTDDTSHNDGASRTFGRKNLFAGLGIAAAVIVTVAVVASLFFGSSNQGYGAELTKEALRDSLTTELAEGWNPEMCFVLLDRPRGLGAAPDDVPAELPGINCLLDDGSANGISTTMVSDEKFAAAVTNPAEGVDMIELGSSPDGSHDVSWLAETGLIYDVTPTSVLRFGPFRDEGGARDFAQSHGMLEAN